MYVYYQVKHRLQVPTLGYPEIMPSRYYPFMSLTGRGHDTFFCRITCKNARIWTFSDWIGNNTDDLRCSDCPKCRHPLVVVDFSLHFCLRNEQWIHTRVPYEISAGSVFLNLKNAWVEVSSIEIISISSYTKTVAVETSPIIWMQFDTGYKLQKR